ncbi:chemotaxis protein CheD [Virgibacillus natechei]|uniref:Probable chemoreceptor glutamine deamidase CheD n=1 Tax=Virgibacillus natechei TaxID=1216297 RepID=A0ABS4IB52_9BACI|nr:chemotaxis protein CheD [Virgibacillus natechei]MBP1968078.1 chemotaxis protein CheD [Virgibacillus natechei]UZD14641.1 chemotaxis protein CheD [Virgibacillus natechei]
MNDQKIIKVGIADLNIVTVPDTIRTSGLGSCVGVVLYDSSRKIAGLAHILLPDSGLTRQENINQYKYADTAIPVLIESLVKAGAAKRSLKAKLAGGAQMFSFTSSSNITRIGTRNSEAVHEKLQELKIPVVSSDLGGNSGRTIEFDPYTCELKIRKIKKQEKII